MSYDDIFDVKELFMLKEFGLPVDQITWPRVTLSNNKLVCVLHNELNTSSSEESMYSSPTREFHQNKVQIIHSSGKIVSRSKTIADSAKIHPSKTIIALKGSPFSLPAYTHFQVYNFETKNLLNELEMDCEVCFWKWASDETIILVTDTTIFQWNVFVGKSELEEVCPRLPRLNYAEIVNCAVDDSQRWYAVTGLVDHGKESLIEGVTQIYSTDYGVAQCIEAHTVTFVSYKFHGHFLNVISGRLVDRRFVDMCIETYRNLNAVHTIELGSSINGNALPRFSSSDLQFSPGASNEKRFVSYPNNSIDFPVSIQVNKDHCVMYVMTKYGRLFIAELESAIVLAVTCVSPDITFCCSLDHLSSAVLVASRSSRVFEVNINWLTLIKYTRNVLNQPELAKRLQNCKGMESVDLLQIN